MKPTVRHFGSNCITAILILTAMVSLPACAQVLFNQQKLDQLLAPVALYPDTLLGQVLTAATYPLEITQAAAFVKNNPQLQGQQLDTLSTNEQWDVSIRALLPFPSVLMMMDQNLPWTDQLGDAFLSQQQAVMDTVQELRHRAIKAGHLVTDRQQRVIVENGDVSIDPYIADVVYVPYYNPDSVYGSWWWPESRPIYWQPPLSYRSQTYGSEIASGIAFGIGIGIVGSLFMDVRPDWHAHHMMVFPHVNRGQAGSGSQWQHTPQHRQGVAYRTPDIRNHFSPMPAPPVSRENFRGRASPMPRLKVVPANQHPLATGANHPDTAHVAVITGQRQQNLPVVQAQPQHGMQTLPSNTNNDHTYSHPMMPSGSRQDVGAHAARGQESRGAMPHSNDGKPNK